MRAATILAWAGWAAVAAGQPQQFRFKFPVGETWKFRFENRTAIDDTKSDGRKVVVTTSEKIDYRWKIVGVAANGHGEIAQSFERVRFDSEGGPGGPVHLDTAEPAEKLGASGQNTTPAKAHDSMK